MPNIGMSTRTTKEPRSASAPATRRPALVVWWPLCQISARPFGRDGRIRRAVDWKPYGRSILSVFPTLTGREEGNDPAGQIRAVNCRRSAATRADDPGRGERDPAAAAETA